MTKTKNFRQTKKSWDSSKIDYVISCDPSKTKKYIEFLFKVYKKQNFTDFSLNQLDILRKIHENSLNNRLKAFDILKFDDFESLEKILSDIKPNSNKLEKIQHFEDYEWVIISPLNFECSKKYSFNTKWCLPNRESFGFYFENFKFFFVINKKSNRKFCFTIHQNSEFLIWNEIDEIEENIAGCFPSHIIDIINKILIDKKTNKEIYLQNNNLESIDFDYYKPNDFESKLNFGLLQIKLEQKKQLPIIENNINHQSKKNYSSKLISYICKTFGM